MKELICKNGEKILLKQYGNYTMVDLGKKVMKLPLTLDKAILYISTLGILK